MKLKCQDRPSVQGRLGRRELVRLGAAFFSAGCVSPGLPLEANPASPRKFRIAVSATMLGDVNENDARASIRAWAGAVTRQTGLEVEYERGVLLESSGLLDAIRHNQVDTFAITVLEYMQVAQFVSPDGLIVDGGGGEQEYCLLVHRNRGIHSLAGLKGRNLLVHRSPATCLAPAWLDMALGDAAPGGFERHFGQVAHFTKLSKVVLPVYFQQMDACLTGQQAFQLMCELNPQLARDLQAVVRSPRLVPSILAFHRQCPRAKQDAFRAALLNLHQSAAGKQALMLFQSNGKFAIANQSVLRSAIEIVNASERIRGRGSRRSS
jgi:ABC-type phosphate/phosphonate transport system substrate-binding protein